MRRVFAVVLISCFAAVAAVAQTSSAAAPGHKPTTEQVLQTLRADVQAAKADILAKNITLSADQAAKFWPLYQAYQKEQSAIIDEQLKSIIQYVDQYEKLDDATALSLINANFDRDAKVNSLRKKYLAEFQKAVPAKVAVRAMQIDRQLSLAHQFEIAARLPLVR